MVSYQDFCRLLDGAAEHDNLETYITDNSCDAYTPQLLKTVWTLGHDGLSIYSIMQINRATMRDLSQEYKIPYRTIQNWKDGARKPPEWLLPLIAYAVLSDKSNRE